MKKGVVRAVLALVIVAASPWAVASGWGALLRDSPAVDFNDEDMRLFLAALRQTLDAPGPAQTVSWRNDASGAGGTLLVLGETRLEPFSECRRTRITLHSRRRQGVPAVFTACRDDSGRWLLAAAG